MSWSFSGAGAGASAAPAVPLPFAQCATKAATKAIRRALGVATELNILLMVAALISGRSFKTPANAVDKVSGAIIAPELALLSLPRFALHPLSLTKAGPGVLPAAQAAP